MAFTLTNLAAIVWRDYNTDGVPSSGKYSPQKANIRQWGLEIERYLNGTSALDQINIDGGAIDGTPVGASSRSTGAFTTLAASGLATLAGGAALSGAITGNPTLSGNPAFTGSPDFSGAANKAAIRSDLGLEIGANVLAYYAKLASLGGLTGAADRVPYMTAANTFALTTFTAAARALLDDADAAAQRTTLELGSAAEAELIDDDTMATAAADNIASAESVKVYTDTQIAELAIGIGQTWQDMSASRAANTSYQNTTGRPIMIAIGYQSDVGGTFQVSTDNATWVDVGWTAGNGYVTVNVIVPDQHYYRSAAFTFIKWAELR